MSRPPRSETGEVASKVVTVRLTPSQHERLQSQKGELSWSDFMLRAIDNTEISIPSPRSPVPEINHQTYVELSRIGNHLNQIARACHQAQHPGHPPVCPDQIDAVAAQLEQVRLELLGIEPNDNPDDDDTDLETDDW